MNYEFLPEARSELFEAALYYEAKEAGLGMRLHLEMAHVIDRILANSYLWRERRGGYRRVNCPVFPYYVAYFIRSEKILIAAIAHGQKKPNYWINRLQ